jgi:radical SAM superfamily enzyme YgiQ (UPF0313 family)
MAAMLRQEVPEVGVAILDAPAMQMGWRTLTSELERQRPAFVAIGEEAVSCVEGLRLARLAKRLGAKVIAGGCFFGHVAEPALGTGLIDVVAHGEGEWTIVELAQALLPGGSLARVQGISYLEDGQLRTTQPRPLIADLDQLPFPAYDLLPVSCYGTRSRNHPGLAAVELSRGCVGSCDFCVLWRQMGRSAAGRMTPHLRVKSPERLLEEIRILAREHGRRYLGWVDPCFNAHPEVPARLAELLLREGIEVGQSAWMRADGLVRDARSGALDACVRAGLNEVYIGVERPDVKGLESLGKTCGVGQVREALAVLRDQHPQVAVVGSFIYGLPGDTPADMRAIHRLAIELKLDQFFFIPLTPLPGTRGWRSEMWDPSGERFREFSFLPANGLGRAHTELERALLWSLATYWPGQRIRNYLTDFYGGDTRRSRVSRRLTWRGARFHLRYLSSLLTGSQTGGGMVFPSWYES